MKGLAELQKMLLFLTASLDICVQVLAFPFQRLTK